MKLSVTLQLFCLLLPLTLASYITHLDVSLDDVDEQRLLSQGFRKIDVDLNKGARGNYIYLWYKNEQNAPAITRLQATFIENMDAGLTRAGYRRIPKDLNAGAGGDFIYLWYLSGNTEYDTPITQIDVTVGPEDEARKFSLGWERLACDLNRKASGNWIHIWVRRATQTYISDVTVTDSFGSDEDLFRQGYIRLDEDTNREAEGAYVFIWYRQTTDLSRALHDIEVSTNTVEHQALQQQSYQPVSVNLNQGTGGNQVYLWYTRGGSGKPIKAINLLFNSAAFQPYERAGVRVIKRNLNTGNDGITEYVCVYE